MQATLAQALLAGFVPGVAVTVVLQVPRTRLNNAMLPARPLVGGLVADHRHHKRYNKLYRAGPLLQSEGVPSFREGIMKKGLVLLTIYSISMTGFLVFLINRNLQLKTPTPSFQIDYEKIHVIKQGDAPVRGDKDAKVTIVVFSDFTCPFCAMSRSNIDQLMTAYSGQIKFVHKIWPLKGRDNAIPAAAAALAAQEQGKFWEMSDLLFDNQRQLDPAFYLQAAGQMGLDLEAFKSYIEGKSWAYRLKTERAEGEQLGVSETPVFFVNGIRVPSYPLLKNVVDYVLENQ